MIRRRRIIGACAAMRRRCGRRPIESAMNYITDCLRRDPQFEKLAESIQLGVKSIYLHGLVKESAGHFIVALANNLNRPVFVVSERGRRAMTLAEEMRSIAQDQVEYYPEEEHNFYYTDSTISQTQGQRLKVMARLARGDRLIITSTLSAIRRRLTAPKAFSAGGLDLHIGDEIAIETLLEQLHFMMYERVTTVDHRGQYAIRGGIVDIFPMVGDDAVRIEFFDTEIDSIRTFDVATQRSTAPVDAIAIRAASELQYDRRMLEEVCKGIRADLSYAKSHEKFGRDDDRAREKFTRLLEVIETQGRVSNDDLISPYLHPRDYAFIMDYLPPDALIVFEDITRIVDVEKAQDERTQCELTDLLERGEILRGHIGAFDSTNDLLGMLRERTVINVTQILKRVRLLNPELLLQMKSLEVEKFANRWEDFMAELQLRLKQKYTVLIFGGKNADQLAARIVESGIAAMILEDVETPLPDGRVSVSRLAYAAGFRYPDDRLLILTNHDITGRHNRTARAVKPKAKKHVLDFQDLAAGDYVVHESYGIGEYLGTVSLEIQGTTKDFLQIRYQGTDQLYISTDEMNLIAKYIGNEGKAPKLSNLGTADWGRAKARAKKAVDAIADDLVELYAKRSRIKGFRFSPDTPWQNDFEDAFPYDETISQLRALGEIKADMESDRPMDRLLCGDVGYGKTEVAIRAAFKAIMDGKQVAFLCPTTILTQQHYSTMLDRYQAYPIRVEFLSRFKTAQQQKAVVDAVNRGEVEMVVGTHRLLSTDVHFKNLGLLIIDEEQRFGVKDKEKIKRFKENIDVLTLSATPIPRTLQLSLTGVRDMSLLEEPPEQRYPTTTYVMEYDPHVIGDAIRKELDRGGQVYFVYNRVYDITRIAEHLGQIVPEARVAIAHGRMTTRQLEQVMERFVSGETDILLSTTIIETGMDIPNVNTLIVYYADHMGLSTLYQLKGRIGRSNRRSYAYFTYEPNKVLTEHSEKRLKAIKDFTEFGSGYKIAMRDLELRGAGNLLGESQSGHVEAIGYDLYVRMLEAAVAKAKGEGGKAVVPEIGVDIKIDAFIPSDYILQNNDKIMMYRSIAAIEDESMYDAIIEELIDRFGDPPKSVINVMDIVMIKRMATAVGFTGIVETGDAVELRYDHFEQFPVEKLEQISGRFDGPLSFDFMKTPKFKIKSTAGKLVHLKQLLKLMLELNNDKENEE